MLSTIPLMSRKSNSRDVQHVLLVLAIDETAALHVGIAVRSNTVHAEHVPAALVEALLAGLVLRHVVDRLFGIPVGFSLRLTTHNRRLSTDVANRGV